MQDFHSKKELQDVVGHFELPEQSSSLRVQDHPGGSIHRTYLVFVEGQEAPYAVLQRLNTHVFPNVDQLMNNVCRVAAHIQKASSFSRLEPVVPIPTKEGGFFCWAFAHVWRLFHFIPRTVSFDICQDPTMAFEAGAACAEFQCCLASMSSDGLYEILPRFQDPVLRVEQLQEALENDRLSRAAEVRNELAEMKSSEELLYTFADIYADPEVPQRIAHNDLKVSNILFDDESKRARSVIDFDACMPGSWLFDFGDLVRSVCISAEEDETDLSRVVFAEEYFCSLTKGYVTRVAELLSEKEFLWLARAPQVVALTLAMRFLADYIDGDRYFVTKRQGQNLDRARNQLHVYRQMCQREERLGAVVAECRDMARS